MPATCVKAEGGGRGRVSVASDSKLSSPETAAPRFRLNDRVTAQYRERGGWFPGRIVRVDGAGTAALYTVLYDDGDKDDGLREVICAPNSNA